MSSPLNQQFQQLIAELIQQADSSAIPLEVASHQLMQAVIGGKRILTAGLGVDLCSAETLVQLLWQSPQQQRPPIPALCISQAGTLSALLPQSNLSEALNQLVKLNVQSGEALLIIASQGVAAWQIAIMTALSQGVAVVVCHPANDSSTVPNGCISITLSGESLATRQQMAQNCVYLLADVIEKTLFPSR